MEDRSGIGMWLSTPDDRGMIRVVMSEELWVACAALGWIGALVLGLVTARLVLP